MVGIAFSSKHFSTLHKKKVSLSCSIILYLKSTDFSSTYKSYLPFGSTSILYYNINNEKKKPPQKKQTRSGAIYSDPTTQRESSRKRSITTLNSNNNISGSNSRNGTYNSDDC
jgi:hypothetical protein